MEGPNVSGAAGAPASSHEVACSRMSAPAFAIPAAPFMGPAAAPKRGAATTDADFAAVLDEAAPSEGTAKAAAPVALKKDMEAAPAPVEDAVAETDAEAAPVADAIVVSVPAPVVTPVPVVVAETVTTAPVAEPHPAPTDDLIPANDAAPAPTAEPSLAAAAEVAQPNLGTTARTAASTDGPVSPSAPADTPAPTETKAGADLPDLTALLPEQPKAAPTPQIAAAAAAVLAAPVTRPAKSSETVAPVETVSSDEAPVAAEAAPLEAPAPQAEAPRTRDVIDRAMTGRAEAQGVSKDAAATDAAPPSDSTEPSAPAAPTTAQPAAARPAVAAEPAVLTLQAADDAVVTAPVAVNAQPVEAKVADPALSLALSNASQASIETTALIAAQIVKKLEGRSVRFEMALTPEGLGNVDVSLDIDADGKLVAKMAFDNPLAATELRGRVDDLRRQLQESGFTVADDALTFAERDASAGQHGGSAFDNRPDPRNARAFGAGARLSAEADIAVPAHWIPLTLTPDRVDMKV